MNLKVDNKRIIDEFGRERIYNGINIVYKGKKDDSVAGGMNYIRQFTDEQFDILKAQGVNLVRFGIVWDAFEREMGVYNEEYFNWIENALNLCKDRGISVFLDMHQDLYSRDFGGGAPSWATLTDGAPHMTGDVWSDAYLFSGAVNTAYRNFWQNKKTEAGKGLLDHYAELWTLVIKRFGNHEAVIGYDFINEPFPGENSLEIFGSLLMAYCAYTGQDKTPEEAMGLFSDNESKLKLLQDIDNTELYTKMAMAGKDLVAQFDEGALANFYVKMTANLREISDSGLVFCENCYFSNLGIESSLQRIEIDGKKEPLQVYSPHGYDLVVDTPLVPMSSNNRIDAILNAHKNVQERLNVPVVFGEWGAHYKNTEALYHLEHILNYFDENKWSHTYYCWFNGYETFPSADVLKRPYPQCASGEIKSYGYDFANKIFHLNWNEEKAIHKPTVIYVPTKPELIEFDGDYTLIENGRDSYLIEIPCVSDGNKEIKIKL